MASHHDAAPVGGPIFTRTFRTLAAIAGAAAVLILWRFVVGLGPSSGMTDGYPWGTWKLFNVIVLTSVASGGYAMALLVYILNKGHYHVLVRHSLLTSAVGYSVAVLALGVDVGRPWNFWRIPVSVSAWNVDSVLLEVALCVSAYLLVLWLELSPAFLERWSEQPDGALGRFARWVSPRMDRIFVWIIAMGILLPSMHQSSLGSLYLLAGYKVHSFWQTPFLPLLFLLSCWIMGYAAVILTYLLSSTRYGRAIEKPMMGSLSRIMRWVIFAFLIVRMADLFWRDQLPLLFGGGKYALLLLVELSLFAVPAFMMLRPGHRTRIGEMFRGAMLVLTAGGLYRLDVTLIAYSPGDGWVYFPSTVELIITLGFIAVQVMAYAVIVKRFPILSSHPARRPARAVPDRFAGTGSPSTADA